MQDYVEVDGCIAPQADGEGVGKYRKIPGQSWVAGRGWFGDNTWFKKVLVDLSRPRLNRKMGVL